jgi:hypothetical protein
MSPRHRRPRRSETHPRLASQPAGRAVTNPIVGARLLAAAALAILAACSSSSAPSPAPQPPAPAPPAPSTAALAATFDESPVPFRTAGCSVSVPQGWYTGVRVRETAGVAFTAATLTQKLDGNTVSFLNESFNSRFGACAGGTFVPGVIPASGAVCATIGVCTAASFGTYQFEITGTDANGHAITFTSPLLQLGGR